MRKKQTGFTLIELVVVITILGILAAFAIPRFANLDSQARVSAVTALTGSLRSAAALAHAEYLAAGTTPSTVTMEGQTVTLNNGYPDATGIQTALQDISGFAVTAAASSVTFQKTGASTLSTCQVIYTVASATTSPPTYTGPTTTGC